MPNPSDPPRLSWRGALAIAAPLLWLGFVLGTAVEAMAKFGAPSLSYPAALDVGRHVFSALNRAEWALAAGLLLGFLSIPKRRWPWLFAVAAGALMAQTFWLLPALATHAELVVQGEQLPASRHHVLYSALEGLKILALGGLAREALRAWRPGSS